MSLIPRQWSSLTLQEKEKVIKRSKQDIRDYSKDVIPIIEDVKARGNAALLEYCNKFGTKKMSSISKVKLTEDEIKKSIDKLDAKVKTELHRAYINTLSFHEHYRLAKGSIMHEVSQGIFAGKKIIPIDSVALYIPQGKGSFPSMVYMLAVPAVLAKVKRIVMLSPPNKEGKVDPACIYIANELGITEIYRMGGAHAIAALTYGTKTIQPIKKIIGPGSAFVSAAKQYVSKDIDVGIPAGPSESMIIADGSTSPSNAAYDLCIEAEHGKDSFAILVTHKAEFAKKVAAHLEIMLNQAPAATAEIVRAVFSNYGAIYLTSNEEESISIVNTIAPEHLMIHSHIPTYYADKITNAGEILLGENTPFSLANYAAGSNAVLPTGGMCRTFSAVSILDFTKEISFVKATKLGSLKLGESVMTLADYEGFYFHHKALEQRQNKT